jgi:iron complex transport system substrate-binding protein
VRIALFRTAGRGAAGLVAIVALTATMTTGCVTDATDSADRAAGVRSVTHDAGTTANVPAAPKRIVSLSVTLTGHLLALDAPVAATQAAPGPFSDPTGFVLQWAEVARQRKVGVAYTGTELNLEKVIEAKPDLIIGSASGGDSTVKSYDQLTAIAPTLMYRYDNVSWQDLTRRIGTDIGRSAAATKVLDDFAAKVAATKQRLRAQTQPVAPLRNNGTEIVVFTAASAQGQLLTSLGLTLRAVPDQLKGAGPEGGNRSDVVTVAQENLGPALGDASVLFVGHSQEQIAKTRAAPLWSSLPAVAEHRVYDLGLDSFRMDYFSAGAVLGLLQTALAA